MANFKAQFEAREARQDLDDYEEIHRESERASMRIGMEMARQKEIDEQMLEGIRMHVACGGSAPSVGEVMEIRKMWRLDWEPELSQRAVERCGGLGVCMRPTVGVPRGPLLCIDIVPVPQS